MKQKKWNKVEKYKRSSYSSVGFKLNYGFKHDGSLETYLELWSKKAIPEHLIFFFNQGNSDMLLDFKKWLQVFLLNGSFDDNRIILFFSWPNMIYWY